MPTFAPVTMPEPGAAAPDIAVEAGAWTVADADTVAVADEDMLADADMVADADTVADGDMVAELGVGGTGLLRLLIEPQDESADGTAVSAAAGTVALVVLGVGAGAALGRHLLAVGTRAAVVAAVVTLGVG